MNIHYCEIVLFAQCAKFVTLQDVLGGLEGEVDTLLEEVNDVAATEEEPAERVALLHLVAHFQSLLEVDATDLRHTDGQHGHEPIVLCLEDNHTTRLKHLPARNVTLQTVALGLVIPDGDAAGSVDSLNLAEFTDSTTNGEVIAVIVVYIKEGMCERTAGKLSAIGTFRTEQVN